MGKEHVQDHTQLGEDPGPEIRSSEQKGLLSSFSLYFHFTETRREKVTCQLAVAEPHGTWLSECTLGKGSL